MNAPFFEKPIPVRPPNWNFQTEFQKKTSSPPGTQGGFELPIWALSMNDLNKVLAISGSICFAGRDARPANQIVGPCGTHGVGSNCGAVD
jgi:hypothetical protein